jgi:non-ribosomal peptide synthetase-like protein
MSSNPQRTEATLSTGGSSAKDGPLTIVPIYEPTDEVPSEPRRSTVPLAEQAPPMIISNPEKPVPKQQNSEYLKGAADNILLIKAAEERLDSLRGLDDVRSSLDLWKEHRYCHRMFRHRAQSGLAEQTCVELWEKPESLSASATYAQMHHYAESVAAWVAASGAETTTRNKVVCIYLPRSIELMASVIGVWYSGACVAVVDTKLPWQRLKYICEDASAALVITSESLVGENPNDFPCPILNVKAPIPDKDSQSITEEAWLNDRGLGSDASVPKLGDATDEDLTDDDCCVVIYTSGSTGNPKGVRLQYGAFSNYAAIEQRLTVPTQQDRIVQTQTLSFIAGFHECWRALCGGSVLVLANSAITSLGPDLEAWLREQEITIMKAVPSLLRSMMIGDKRPNLPKLRVFHIGGEAVTQDLVDCFGHGRLFLNTYGSTESCSNCLIGFCTPGDEQCTIGKALPSFKAFILESPESEVEVPVGELYIWGRSLALDYLNLDDTTKAVFIQHPLFGRLYKTGDNVERLANSNIVYRGRGDNQTKINGYRVEMGEVEASMNKLPIIQESAAVAVNGTLYAFVSLVDGQDSTLTLDILKKSLTEIGLPFFALPSRLTILEEFPKTISGKLDRKVLKVDIEEANKKASEAGAAYDQATVLGVLMAAFSEVLRVTVQPTDDFFSIGGDSASAGQTVGLIRFKGEKIDLPNLSILDMYTHRTPKALEEYIGRTTESGGGFVEDVFRAKRMPTRDSPRPLLFSIVSFLFASFLMFVDGIEVFWYFIIIWASDFAIPVTREATVIVPKFSGIFDIAFKLFIVKIGFYVVWLFLSIIIKWTVVGRYREGRWAKYGSMHLRHWIVVRVTSHLPWRIIGGTGISKLLMRAMGAKIGKGTFTFWEPSSGAAMSGYDLYELEEYSSICQGAYCSPIYFTEDSMVCGRIYLGRSSSLYPRSTVSGSVRLEEGAVLDTLSNAMDGSVLGPWEVWSGSPASCTGEAGDRELPTPNDAHSEILLTILMVLDVFFGYYLVFCISMFPRYGLLVFLNSRGLNIASPGVFIASVFVSIFFGCLALTLFSIAFVRAASFLSPSRPGAYHLYSWTTLVLWHKLFWFKSPQLMLNNTRFLQWFSGACGMDLGQGSHISNVKGCIPDLVSIGRSSFLANPVFLGVPVVRNLMFHVGRVDIGDDVLVGNNACFPIGTSVPSNSTVAVNTGAPPSDASPGGVWVGNPPVRITDNVLVPHPHGRKIDRAIMLISEVLIIFVPGTFWALTILTWLYLFVFLINFGDIFPDNKVIQAAFGAALLIPIRAAWAIIAGLFVRVLFSGFARNAEEKNVGYWDPLCYRWRIYNKVWAFYLIPMLLDDFTGCMWMNRLMRLLTTCIIEDNVLIVHHGLFKDHNYVRVRRGATINESCVLRTHTFEDWRLKFGFVDIGPDSVVLPSSTVMFGAVTGPNCTILPNTLVLKGDKLAADTIAGGIPAVPVKNRASEDTDDQNLLTEVRAPTRRNKAVLILAVILVVAGTVGLAVSLTFLHKDPTELAPTVQKDPAATSDPAEAAPTLTTGPTVTNDSIKTARDDSPLLIAYRERFYALIGESVWSEGTAASRAVEWLALEDGMKLDAPNLLQRYALALLYFQTIDRGDPAMCTHHPLVDNDSCTFVDGCGNTNSAMLWLSSAHECDWARVHCTIDGTVSHLDLTRGIDKQVKDILPDLELVNCGENDQHSQSDNNDPEHRVGKILPSSHHQSERPRQLLRGNQS